MRCFVSTQKATRSFLSYGLHGCCLGSGFQFLLTSNSMWSKSIGLRCSLHLCQSSPYAATMQSSSSLFPCHGYSTSSILIGTHSSYSEVGHNTKKVDLQIISRETIKPTSPTPHHLRTFNLSIIDQFMFDCYNPLILFLPNNDNACLTDVVTKRSKHLKETLSEILTRFYPFAGEVKDNLHIECNDKGVHFVEARVNQTLQDFLCQPDDQKVKELIPTEPSSTNHVISVQANIFDCGGMALSANLSHKIVDGHSYFLFINAWAAAARGSPEKISPSYVASELFPNNPSLKYSLPTNLTTTKVLATKRFVFDSTALASLKAATSTTMSPLSASPSHGVTRTEATGALIWKVAAKAASTIRAFSPQSPHVLLSAVNLRNRALPPLPKESIGNLITSGVGICFPDSQPELPALVGEMRESIAKINSDFIDARKGEQGHETWNEMLKAMNDLFNNIGEGDSLFLTSLLNSRVYETDFGWGKPIWFYYVNPGTTRLATLNDTIKGGGVEAMVSLSPEEMEIFERDEEILSYTTVDPSPLQFGN